MVTTRIPRRCLFFVGVLCLCVLLLGCSEEKQDAGVIQEDRNPTTDAENYEIDAGEDAAAVTDEEYEEYAEESDEFLYDLGAECEDHEYVLSPGEVVVLDFGRRMKVSEWMLPYYELEEPVNLENISVKQHEKYGSLEASVDIDYMSIEEVSLTRQVWAFDGTEMFADNEWVPGKDIALKTNDILWTNDGYGVIEGLLNVEGASLLTEDELRVKTGIEKAFRFSVDGTEYVLPLTQTTVEQTLYFVEVEVTVAVPQEFKKRASTVEFWLQTMRGTDYLTYAKWPIKIGYNINSKKFHITGPAEYAACW